ncbi:MAG: hypothetical protein IT300_14995, partial [Dehalococcoidia bacterium]|nr:hypothetical protein [Dehalococcoidia bacterium]
MYDAQTLQCTDTTATTVYSPWFPRGGDYGIFTLELVSMSSTSANLSLSVQLVSKNTSETGDGANVGSAISRTGSNGAGRSQGDITAGFEELVRYKFTLQLSTGSGVNWAVFRMLAPVWYDK